MVEAVALYYPFIHFRDEEWLKVAVLYWPKITRIVPPGYELRDSETVRRLADELDLIHSVSPTEASFEVGALFARFLEEHEGSLRDRYGVDKAYTWTPDPVTVQRMALSAETDALSARLAHIYAPKFDRLLLARLLDAGLAVHSRDNMWVGVHPELGNVYMAALADQISRQNHLHPVTEDTMDHLAVTGWTMAHLAQALLGERALEAETHPSEEISVALAFVALRAVHPKSRPIDVKKIIRIRKRHEQERLLFSAEVERLGTELNESLADVHDTGALRAHLGAVFNATLGQHLDALRREIRDVGLDTALGTMSIRLEVPALLRSAAVIGGFTLHPYVGLGGAVAMAAAGLTRSQHRQTRELMFRSPAAYLLRIDRELAPASLLERIRAGLSRFTRGV